MPARASPAAPGIATPPPPRPCFLPSMAPRLHTHLSPPPKQRRTPLGTIRTIRSFRSRQGLSSSWSRCGQCRCCVQRGSGHRNARRSPSPRAQSPCTPGAAAAAHSGGTTGTTRLPPRSQRDPQRREHLLYLPGWPVVVDVCVTHPLASSVVAAAAWGTGVSAEAKDTLKRDKYGRIGTGACCFVPLSHETYCRAGPPTFALLHEHAELAASTGAVSLCRSTARQVLASAPSQTRLDGRPVLPGRPVPTGGLA